MKREVNPEALIVLSDPTVSKSRRAVALMQIGYSVSEAAKLLNVAVPTVSKAWKRAARPVCPHCGQVIKGK